MVLCNGHVEAEAHSLEVLFIPPIDKGFSDSLWFID